MLRARAEEATPRLIDALGHASNPLWLYYALGRCGTSQGRSFLESRFATEEINNTYYARSLVHAVSLTGEPGARFLTQSHSGAQGSLKAVLQEWSDGKLPEHPIWRGRHTTPQLPPPAILPLPSAEDLLALAAARN